MKLRFWYIRVKPQNFQLLSPSEDQLPEAVTDFVLKNPNHHQLFCKTCGVHAFHKMNIPQFGGEFYSVNVGCFDGLEGDDWKEFKIRYLDGRNDSYMKEPVEKDIL